MKLERWDNQETIVNDDECKSMRELLEKYKDKISFAYSDLHGSNLSGSDLSDSDLSDSDLSYSDLSNSDLRGSNLSYSDLSYSDLQNIIIAPPSFLFANWGKVSDALCVHLMRYDAANHPEPQKFLEWAKTGTCPYQSTNVLRSANFTEKRSLITEDFLSLPVKSAYELTQMLIAEKGKQKENA